MRNKILLSAIVSAGICVFLIPGVTSAHPTGASFNKIVGPYLIDIGYNPVYPEINTREAFDFRLWQATSTTNIVTFSDVFIQIKKDDTILLSTTSKQEDIFYPTLVFTPPVAGRLSMYVRYELNGKEITETTMPLNVVDPNDMSGLLESVLILMGVFLPGLALYWGVKLYKKTRV